MARPAATGRNARDDAQADARAQQEAVEEALAAIAVISAGGLTAMETALADGLRQTVRRLVAIADQIAGERLTVTGSMGQLRPHPLLSEERALRREIEQRLPHVEVRVGNRCTIEAQKRSGSSLRLSLGDLLGADS
jgi:hypothetical protein